MEAKKDSMGTLAHVLGLLTGFVGPLILYFVVTPDQTFARDHVREALNFQITVLIGIIISGILAIVIIGFLGFLVIGILDLIWSIMAAVAANNGETYRYPVSIRLIN